MVNVAFERGAACEDSDPFLIGPGRMGVTRITPVIPVLSAFDSLRTTDAHTIRNNTLMATKRHHISLAVDSRTSLPSANISCELLECDPAKSSPAAKSY